MPTWFPGLTGSKGRRHRVPAQRDRQMLGNGCLSRAESRRPQADPPHAGPCWPQGCTGRWIQAGQEPMPSWGGGGRPRRGRARGRWSTVSWRLRKETASARASSVSGAAETGAIPAHPQPWSGVAWRGSSPPWARAVARVCMELHPGGARAGRTYCAGIASSSNRADQEIRKIHSSAIALEMQDARL